MKLFALMCGSLIVGLSAQTYLIDSAEATQTSYVQSIAIEKDYVEIVYLPNNTCQIDQPGPTPMNVKDYVRACMNNRHLHTRMRR
jgi:hypothetical protein|tara:strand:+ start:898 stop:1152 length:255 start_codon:yes stop_codon:yes gene_type:complete